VAKHICDVPGCGRARQRRHRLCPRCFGRLPGEIRVGIAEAHHQRRFTDWSALKKRAAAFLNLDCAAPAGAVATVSPERAYELQARLLGERPDA
jgi:hypothetical protein